jgi:putative hydrolase of the HAD superfamily
VSVDAVIFDWGGTLSEWAAVEFDEVWRMAARHLAPHVGESEDALARRLARVELDAWAEVQRDHRSFGFADLVGRASRALGVDVADALVAEAEEHYLGGWLPHITHFEDAAPTLEALRRQGVRTALLSNTHWPRDFHERMLERDGLAHLLDERLYTSELPYMKPHPEAFGAALRALGIPDPSRAVYVGDRLFDDVHGAQQAGLRAIHRRNDYAPPFDVRPDASIGALAEVPGIIERWRRA